MRRGRKNRCKISLLLVLLAVVPGIAVAQNKEVLLHVDSVNTITSVTDTTAGKEVKKVRVYNPGKAALRSALLPGLGQIYNKKYWKLPIVYGALGTSAGIFAYNFKNYKDTRFAYRVKYNMRVNKTDTVLFDRIRRELKPLSEESLRFYRDEFRRDIDYSVLFFVLLWGLNVVDAAVDAHLKSFDVSPDLSLNVKPGYSEMAGTSGLSVVLSIGKKKQTGLLPTRF